MAEDDAFLEENLDESLEDLASITNWAQGAVLWSTDWTAETILSQLNRSNIDLDPSFQRRSAWTDKKQSLFIESLILGLPIPQLILAEAPGRRGSFIVIDGKQRLLAIRRFGTLEKQSEFSPLKLRGLNELKRLNNKNYADLQSDLALADDLSAFDNASIRTIVIRNWQNEEYLYEVFLRINTGSVQLSPQELRQALHPGPFSRFIGDASADSDELKLALNLKAPDFRMRDAEVLLRYIAYRNFINTYNGNLKFFLDETTRLLTDAWNVREAEIRDHVREMEEALKFTKDAFTPQHYLRKWNGETFESKKNRAIFDIMLHYFSRPEVRHALRNRISDIKPSFQSLCDDDQFRSSLETTTKSMEANRTRFNIWGQEIERLSGLNLDKIKFPG
ncbi:DUF262 domain-containing protein [Asaia bogorensis]|uniref:DUF262 domain-containing protein n=1 Tax=Asaia bogorensis TaxID=91915 RepID=UPI00285C351A|nr:DUF262 domain-containing protein [Asaia bogorensis]MDR6183266.1 hypothetical protein [Asaia bogorensis NBRC 16594]